jgi:hypothetical protein
MLYWKFGVYHAIPCNVPHRTGKNIENQTLFKLSEFENIIGVKDSCGNINQSIELIFNSPDNFSVLIGTKTAPIVNFYDFHNRFLLKYGCIGSQYSSVQIQGIPAWHGSRPAYPRRLYTGFTIGNDSRSPV